MPLSTPGPGASVPERLIAGVIALVGEGNSAPSVRQIADRAGRSTMCVYSDFGGRRKLLEAAHRRVSDDLIGAVESESEADPFAAAEAWVYRERKLAEWLFSRGAPDDSRSELIARLGSALGTGGMDRLALIIGRLLLTT